MRARQRQRAQEVQQNKTGDTQHGPSFEKDAREAARRREQNRLTPDQRLDNLIGKAARELGIKLPEENKLGEGMLPVPSDKRKRIINPMIAAMPPKTEKGINNAMKKGLEDLNTKYQKLYDKLNSVPKDGKA